MKTPLPPPCPIRLYLDDLRPCPPGWTVARSMAEAQALVLSPDVLILEMSLDHDLGACVECVRTVPQAAATLHCAHVPNGYDFVQWLEETQLWPPNPPQVHSRNPTGRQNLLHAIARHYPSGVESAPRK